MRVELPIDRSLLEIHISHSTVPVFTKPKHSGDPLPTLELDEQRSTPRHENETENQSANGDARGNFHDVVLINWSCRGLLGRGWVDFRDIVPRVFLQGDRRMILLVTFDFYRKNTEA